MSVKETELILRTSLTPGEATFSNYEYVKEYLRKGLEVYNNTEYTVKNAEKAKADFYTLKKVKQKLFNMKKQLLTDYSLPIQKVTEQLDELILMVKQPMDTIDRMLKANEKEIKKQEIYEYAYWKSTPLGRYAESVIQSPAFFNPKWKNKTYRDLQWQCDVDTIIGNARKDITLLFKSYREDFPTLVAYYINTLSIDKTLQYYDTLNTCTVNKNIETQYKGNNSEIHIEVGESTNTCTVNKNAEMQHKVENSGIDIEVDESTGEIISFSSEELPMQDDKITKVFVRITGTEANIEKYIQSAVKFNLQAEIL